MPVTQLGIRPPESGVATGGTFTLNPIRNPKDRAMVDSGLRPFNSVDVFNNTAEPIEIRVNGDPENFYMIAEGGTMTIVPEEDDQKMYTLVGINRGANNIDPNSTDVGVMAIFKRLPK